MTLQPPTRRLIDDACDRFERDWATVVPDLDAYLPTDPAARPGALLELAKLDLELRRTRRGEAVGARGYFKRFPELLADAGAACELIRHDNDIGGPRDASPAADVAGYYLNLRLGEGGMGEVYDAFQLDVQRRVALKVTRDRPADELAILHRRFAQEARAVAGLCHPYIVCLYDFGRAGERPYFTMELCAGGSLADHLGGRPVDSWEAARLVQKLAEAIAHAHAAGVIHRDLKPGNVLLQSADGTRHQPETRPSLDKLDPKVADFGLARNVDGPRQTLTAAQIGTPAYMSPEQTRGDTTQVGPASDIYSLGVILYECLTGLPPFVSTCDEVEARAAQLFSLIQDGKIVAPRQLNPNLPRDLETICLHCLHTEPAKRYASAQALADDLGRFLRGEPIHAQPVGPFARAAKWARRNPAVAFLTAGIALTLVFGTVVSLAYANEARSQAVSAENRRVEAVRSKEAADEARDAAEKSALLAQERSAVLAFERGILDCQQNGKGLGLPRFAQALQLAPQSSAAFREPIRYNLAHWLAATPRLEAVAAAPSPFVGLAITPDGKRVFTSDQAGNLLEWDANARPLTSRNLGWPGDRDARPTHLTVSPSGATLYCAGFNGEVRRFDLRNGQTMPLAAWSGRHTSQITAIAASPTGRHLASCDDQGQLIVWNTADGGVMRRMWPLGKDNAAWRIMRSVEFSPDGTLLLTAGFDGTARILEVVTGKQLSVLVHNPVGVTWSACFVPVGRQLYALTGGFEGNVNVWNLAGTQLDVGMRRMGPITRMVPRPGTGQVLITSSDQTAVVWNGRTVGLEEELLHPSEVITAAWGADGNSLVVACNDSLRVWNLVRPRRDHLPMQLVGLPPGGKFSPGGTDISADGNLTAMTDQSPAGRVWITRNVAPQPEPVLAIPAQGVGVSEILFVGAGPRILLGRVDGVVSCWDIDAKARIWENPPGKENAASPAAPRIQAITVTPDGRTWAAATYGGEIQLGSLTDGAVTRTIPVADGSIHALVFSADGKHLVAGTGQAEQGILTWLEVATGKVLGTRTLADTPFVVALSPDGRTVLAAGVRSQVRFFDMATREPTGPSILQEGGVSAAAFSPDGRLLATCGGDGSARLWHLPSGRPVGPIRRAGTLATHAKFVEQDCRLVIKSLVVDGERTEHRTSFYPLPVVAEDDVLTRAAYRAVGRRITSDDRFEFQSAEEWARLEVSGPK